MKIIGIDPSLTNTGLVIIEDNKFKAINIKTKPTNTVIEELKRLLTIRDGFKLDGVDIAVMEGVAFGIRKTSALSQLSALNYLIRERLYREKVPFIIVPPTVLKKFITSRGNAKKEEMLLETYKRYEVSFNDNNTCDAYGLAKIGEAVIDKSIKILAFQKDIINNLREQYGESKNF
jgi:crossover junction endodeoxyribonuclease RuvC